jgi:hypothetical protein
MGRILTASTFTRGCRYCKFVSMYKSSSVLKHSRWGRDLTLWLIQSSAALVDTIANNFGKAIDKEGFLSLLIRWYLSKLCIVTLGKLLSMKHHGCPSESCVSRHSSMNVFLIR